MLSDVNHIKTDKIITSGGRLLAAAWASSMTSSANWPSADVTGCSLWLFTKRRQPRETCFSARPPSAHYVTGTLRHWLAMLACWPAALFHNKVTRVTRRRLRPAAGSPSRPVARLIYHFSHARSILSERYWRRVSGTNVFLVLSFARRH